MSEAYQCDRCGSYADSRGSRLIQKDTGTAGINKKFHNADVDLCCACTNELTDWWNND